MLSEALIHGYEIVLRRFEHMDTCIMLQAHVETVACCGAAEAVDAASKRIQNVVEAHGRPLRMLRHRQASKYGGLVIG
jgi:hypothetical protein